MQPSASPDADAPSTDRPMSMVLRWTRRAVGRISGDREAALAEAPDTSLLDALPDPVILVDAEDRVYAISQAVVEVFGVDPEEIVGEDLAERLIELPGREAYHACLERAADNPDEREEPALLAAVRADGTEVPVALTIRAVRDSALFAVTLRHAKAARADAIDDRRRTLRTILDALPEAVVAVDPQGRILFRNRASVGGRSRRDASQRALPDAEWRAAEAVMRAGQPAVGEEPAGPAGGIRLTTRIPVRSASGAIVGLVALSRDVTAEKADAARLLDDKRAAEAAARANSEILATTSHEVRTLMSGVTGMTQLLLSTDLEGDQRDYAETIRTQSATLLRIVNDVLDLSKMDAGMLTLEREPFQVSSVVDGALAVVVQQAGAKGLALSSEVAEAVPAFVVGDGGRIQQVLANLLTNAVKFTDEGAVRLRVGLTDGGRALGFAVEDTGVGIAPDRIDAVFEEFVQADASTARTHGGTGLGLAICRRLVEQMGGELTAASSPRGGSVFRFTIPLETAAAVSEADDTAAVPPPASPPPTQPAPARPTAAPPAPAPASTPMAATFDAEPEPAAVPPPADAPVASAPPAPTPPTPPTPPTIAPTPPPAAPPATPAVAPRPLNSAVMDTASILPAARVLLVEDDPVMQKVTSHTLLRLGYRPTVVSNGAQGVMAARGKPYDVILMDIMMPVMDGLDATRKIREDSGPHPQPAIVMLTANAMKNDRVAGMEAGADAYLTKPVEPRELAATIEQAIRTRTEPSEDGPEAVTSA